MKGHKPVSDKGTDVSEEVVDMEADVDGTYKSKALVVVNSSHRPPMIPRRIPVMLEFLGGFVMGLEALENFMVNMKKLNKRRKYET